MVREDDDLFDAVLQHLIDVLDNMRCLVPCKLCAGLGEAGELDLVPTIHRIDKLGVDTPSLLHGCLFPAQDTLVGDFDYLTHLGGQVHRLVLEPAHHHGRAE